MPVKTKFSALIARLSFVKEYYFILSRFAVSVQETVTEHPVFIFLYDQRFSRRYLSRKNPVVNYIYKLISTFLEAGILVGFSGILSFLIYYTLGMLWYLYTGTPMGDKFFSLHPQQAQTIMALSELDLVSFCAEVTLSAFVICFAIGSISRFLHISDYLYLSQGLFGKLVYWGIPLTGAVSYYIKYEYRLCDWQVTGCIVMIPTYLLFMSCFKYSQKLVPEAGDVIRILILRIKWIRHASVRVYFKIRDLAQNHINQS